MSLQAQHLYNLETGVASTSGVKTRAVFWRSINDAFLID